MGEDTTTTAAPATADGTNLTPQAGDATSTTSQADESQNSSKPQKSAEDYERMIAELRKENASHRTRLKKVEEEEAKRLEAQLSKEQLLEKQYNELKAQHEEYTQAQLERTINHEVSMEAAKLGVNPKHLDKIARFIEWDDIEVDDQTGNPTNIRTMVEQLIKDMPELLSKGTQVPTSGGATNPPRSQSTTPQALSWSVISKMKPDEYDARRAEIQRWMLDNPPRYR